MEVMTDAEKKQRAELFLEKIAAKLPVKSTSESTVIGLFEGIVESLGKNPVRTAILADLDYFYGVFEVALTKKLEETQHSQSSSSVHKRDDVVLKKIANESFPAIKARMLLGTVDVNFVNSKIVEDESSDETPNEKKELRILIAVQCAQLSAPQIALSLLNSVTVIQPSVDSGNLSKALISRYRQLYFPLFSIRMPFSALSLLNDSQVPVLLQSTRRSYSCISFCIQNFPLCLFLYF
jgi:hypothetical protein